MAKQRNKKSQDVHLTKRKIKWASIFRGYKNQRKVERILSAAHECKKSKIGARNRASGGDRSREVSEEVKTALKQMRTK